MKRRTIFYSLLALCVTAFAITQNRVAAQGDLDSPAGAELLQDLQKQQVTINDNQKQIDEKLTNIGEALRMARIFVSRGGK